MTTEWFDLRFEGDLNVWFGLTLAMLASFAMFKLYRRETHTSSRRAARLLPLIRAALVAMILLMLTGPVLRGSVSIADLSRVIVFVDGSNSMTLTDETMSVDRKMLNARRLGLIEADSINADLHDAAQLLASVREPIDGATGEETLALYQRAVYAAIETLPKDEPLRRRMSDSLLSSIEKIEDQLGREIYSERRLMADLEYLRASADRWRGLLETEHKQRMSLVSPSDGSDDRVTTRVDEMTRWKRAEAALLTDNGALLPNLASEHQVDLLTVSGESTDGRPVSLWRRVGPDEFPDSFEPVEPTGRKTDLASEVATVVRELPSTQRLAVVLLSDGQHNRTQIGPDATSPLHLARLLGRRGVPMFTVGFGAEKPPADLAVLGVQTPESVFADDRVKGDILIKDHMPAGQPMQIKIEVEGQTVWSDEQTTTGTGARTVEFDFAIKDLVETRLAGTLGDLDSVSLALPLVVSIEPMEGETRDDNNSYAASVRAITRPRRALLIDGRPRWEFRYLRNMLDRDEHWQVNHVLAQSDQGRYSLPRGSRQGSFPLERDQLFSYDVILLGEVPADVFRADEFEWLTEFVGTRGGGLMLIDGQRGKLRSYAGSPLKTLLPVRWTGDHRDGLRNSRLLLSDRGLSTAALALAGTSEESAVLWGQLPRPRWVAPVDALPGCDVLVSAGDGEQRRPALVMRRFGAGTILYSGFDDSWRWRFELGDRVHGRYWNQIATFIMESPFAVHDRFVSIDTGGFSYQPRESANLKVRLRDRTGRPLVDETAEAILYQDDRQVATVPLEASAAGGSVLRGATKPLEPGAYQVGVRADGLDEESLAVRAEFVVMGEVSGEMNVLQCNEELLRQMAEMTGGQYLREEDASRLPDLLAPHADGSEEPTEIVLWRSWYWFTPILGLFTLEWFLRKRLGMM